MSAKFGDRPCNILPFDSVYRPRTKEAAEPMTAVGATVSRALFDDRFAGARDRLIRICTSLVGADAAEDVVHDTYVVARRQLGRLRDPAALDAWLNRIAVTKCYDHHRSRRPAIRLTREPISPARHSDPALREMVERLPPRERTVVVLSYGYGFQLDEIGDLLGLSHTNVRSIIARTRHRLLREWMEAE
jgi:RNA polymerase sigma-70 factor (ECF subfamily)